jgi:hypothetical protein
MDIKYKRMSSKRKKITNYTILQEQSIVLEVPHPHMIPGVRLIH